MLESGSRSVPMPIVQGEAEHWNKLGYGIHWCVNELDTSQLDQYGRGRNQDNIIGINSWCVESDDLSIDEQIKTLNEMKLEPSLVVRSKKSLHIYFNASDATKENYKHIQKMLVKLFHGDNALTHPAITLRAPGFYHCKDINDPFMVHTIHESVMRYKEWSFMQILEHAVEKRFGKKRTTKKKVSQRTNLVVNQKDALERLSGAAELNCETYTFKRTTNNNLNIIVNGKSTSSFIDANGFIGSQKKGGPTVLQWVQYFGYSKSAARDIVLKYIPEMEGTI